MQILVLVTCWINASFWKTHEKGRRVIEFCFQLRKSENCAQRLCALQDSLRNSTCNLHRLFFPFGHLSETQREISSSIQPARYCQIAMVCQMLSDIFWFDTFRHVVWHVFEHVVSHLLQHGVSEYIKMFCPFVVSCQALWHFRFASRIIQAYCDIWTVGTIARLKSRAGRTCVSHNRRRSIHMSVFCSHSIMVCDMCVPVFKTCLILLCAKNMVTLEWFLAALWHKQCD